MSLSRSLLIVLALAAPAWGQTIEVPAGVQPVGELVVVKIQGYAATRPPAWTVIGPNGKGGIAFTKKVVTQDGGVAFAGTYPGDYLLLAGVLVDGQPSNLEASVTVGGPSPVPPNPPNPPPPGPTPDAPAPGTIARAAYDAAVPLADPANARVVAGIYRSAGAKLAAGVGTPMVALSEIGASLNEQLGANFARWQPALEAIGKTLQASRPTSAAALADLFAQVATGLEAVR